MLARTDPEFARPRFADGLDVTDREQRIISVRHEAHRVRRATVAFDQIDPIVIRADPDASGAVLGQSRR